MNQHSCLRMLHTGFSTEKVVKFSGEQRASGHWQTQHLPNQRMRPDTWGTKHEHRLGQYCFILNTHRSPKRPLIPSTGTTSKRDFVWNQGGAQHQNGTYKGMAVGAGTHASAGRGTSRSTSFGKSVTNLHGNLVKPSLQTTAARQNRHSTGLCVFASS